MAAQENPTTNLSELDAQFKAMAEEAEHDEREKAARRGSGFQKSYEKLQWTGLEKGKLKVIRAIGKHPDFRIEGDPLPNREPWDARVVRIASIVNDKGKRMRLVLPLMARDNNHLLWRIINRINHVEWIPGSTKDAPRTKVFVNQDKHNNVFNIVNYNNLSPSDPKRKFGLMGKGWLGKDVLIMNVIDRAMMDWHKSNKHTVLLSKNIDVVKGNTGDLMEFVDEGIPAFGFTSLIQSAIIKFYGYWGNYDIGIEKTGLQTNPYRLINASKIIEQVPAELQKLVSSNPLTDEESGWETYNLDKLFGVSTYSKIWNNLKLTIATIDKELGTNYFDELKTLSDAETEDRKNNKAPVVPEDSNEEEEEFVPSSEEEPVRQRVATKTATPVQNVKVPAWDKLSEKEKSMIVSATPPSKEGETWTIVYTENAGKMGKCPDCSNKSGENFSICPICSLSFTF